MTRVRAGSWNGIAERGDVRAEELELRRGVGPVEDGVAARQVARERVRHLVAGGDEPVDRLAMEGHLADREDALVARAQAVVDDDAAARADLDPRGARELVARANAGRDDHHVERRSLRRPRSRCPRRRPSPRICAMRLSTWTCDAELADRPLEEGRGGDVELSRHEARGDLDHVRLEPRVEHGPRGLEPEESAADDRRAPRARRVGEDRLEVLDGAVDEDAPLLDTRNGRHEGRRTRGEDEDVVAELGAVVRRDDPPRAVDAGHAQAERAGRSRCPRTSLAGPRRSASAERSEK